ncbi:MAG TPA: cell envelope integrity protein CreD [Solimonas sp.]|nr:cell envelope integrity protein CreD [Solimonas sp.]
MSVPAAPPPRRPFWSSPIARLLILGLLFVLLLIPLGMIGGVVAERSQRQAEAQADITSKWGGAQSIVGPLLRVACVHRFQQRDDKGWKAQSVVMRELYLLPETLEARVQLNTEIRRRGIFEVPVYAAAVTLEGRFATPLLSQCPQPSTEIDWRRTDLVIGIADPRSVQAEAGLVWNGRRLQFAPATGAEAPLASGLHVPLGGVAGAFAQSEQTFSIVLSLRGANLMQLAPVGKETRVSIAGDWPHPSFQGAWLPLSHEADAQGFDARWSLSWLGRDYPQAWTSAAAQAEPVSKSLFGVMLATPVDPYAMAVRVTKYAALTVLFTFFTVWLTEVLSGGRVHPIQYGFIGAALCLFGLLQLSFAEHFGFTPAFVVAALAVTALVTLYCRSVLGHNRRALGVGALLGGLYGYLYAILSAEDYALLGGSVALFALLALAMYLTRRIDWVSAGASAMP